MYQIRNLENISFQEFADTHNRAFADYVVPMQITPDEIEAYFKASGVDYARSSGAFYQNELVGILVNAVDIYKGEQAAWDAMTGIVKEHRGKGLFSAMFEHTRQCLKDSGISRYYLDVITTNENACAVYQKKGGRVEREFAFLSGQPAQKAVKADNISLIPLTAFLAPEVSCYQPSFGNRLAGLRSDAANYQVAECGKAAVVFSRQGRIYQIRYPGREEADSLCMILGWLSQRYGEMSISNIPITEKALLGLLLEIGYTVKVKQYEMRIQL